MSVCLSHACIVTKRKKDLSIFLHHTKDDLAQFTEKKNGWWGTTSSRWNFGSMCACALLFTVPCAFFRNGGDRGLRVRVIILLRQYGFDVCWFVCLWRVDRLFVTSWPCDELTVTHLPVETHTKTSCYRAIVGPTKLSPVIQMQTFSRQHQIPRLWQRQPHSNTKISWQWHFVEKISSIRNVTWEST